MKLNKLLTILSLSVLPLTMVSCGGESSQSNKEEKIKIGVIMYAYSDIQGRTIQNYCNYLSQNMNVEFAYEATNYQDDLHVSSVENLISAGCKAIIAGYDTSIVSAVDTCAAAGVYYTLALDHAQASDFSGAEISNYFLGGTMQFGGDLTALGNEYAQIAHDAGLKNLAGVSFPAWAFTEAPEIYSAFKAKSEELDSSASVQDLTYSTGFMQTDIETATNSVLQSSSNLDAIFGMSSGIDYVYPVIRDTNVKLISMGYDTSVRSLFESGKLVASGTNNYVQLIASCVARIFNAIDGKQYSDASSGTYNKDGIVNGVAGYPLISSVSDVDDFEKYIIAEDDMTKCPVTVDELKNVILRYNENATLADLNTLTNRSLATIKAARN